jgi:hypothetical protein
VEGTQPYDAATLTAGATLYVEGVFLGAASLTWTVQVGFVTLPYDVVYFTVAEVDIDTDSDNSGVIEGTEAEDAMENAEGQPGKRIFVNNDDDNKNGLPDNDARECQWTYGDQHDDDFAEIKLGRVGFDPSELSGCKLQVSFTGPLRPYATKDKVPLENLEWQLGRGAVVPESIFAEGIGVNQTTGVSECTVTWRLVRVADGKVIDDDTVKIRVEERVYPFKDQAGGWSQQPTRQWKGLSVGEAWYMDKALVDYITHPEDQGELETRRPDLPNKVASVAGKDSTSQQVTFANGFTIEFDYSFATDHGDPDTGYVQAAGQPLKKVSFVGNSGVKFGSYTVPNPKDPNNPLTKDFEINILDVPSMVSVAAPDWPTFKPNIKVSGTAPNKVGTVAVPNFVPEQVNTLMAAVRYGGGYQYMADWGDTTLPAQNLPTSVDDFYSILTRNAGHNAGHMTIEVQEASGNFAVTVSIDGIRTYFEGGIAMTIAPPRLQTHWGSGVVFENVIFAEG